MRRDVALGPLCRGRGLVPRIAVPHARRECRRKELATLSLELPDVSAAHRSDAAAKPKRRLIYKLLVCAIAKMDPNTMAAYPSGLGVEINNLTPQHRPRSPCAGGRAHTPQSDCFPMDQPRAPRQQQDYLHEAKTHTTSFSDMFLRAFEVGSTADICHQTPANMHALLKEAPRPMKRSRLLCFAVPSALERSKDATLHLILCRGFSDPTD